jgi:hypothetical protein
MVRWMHQVQEDDPLLLDTVGQQHLDGFDAGPARGYGVQSAARSVFDAGITPTHPASGRAGDSTAPQCHPAASRTGWFVSRGRSSSSGAARTHEELW